MAHIYMTFDFGSDEDKAQQARHKLEGWKQAFRLDKKLLYKFERTGMEEAAGESEAPEEEEKEKPAKGGKGGKTVKAKAKSEPGKSKAKESVKEAGNVKLYLRLALSNHEKMTEERLVKRIPAEEPFSEADPKMVKDGGTGFAEVEAKFESLE